MGEDIAPTLISRYETQIGNTQDKLNVMQNELNTVVRRLTPMECERLQGYPDHWTDIGEWTDSKGKLHKDADSPRYKALGNSIALPFWEWMAKRMVSHLDADKPTMASLFDGIGGFPLVYSRAGCEPIWASEIEEFPIAVTKIRFPEEKTSDS
jgi:DNA (cytosine-5)-methyltransferase 1